MTRAVIVGAVRTPIGKFGGVLAALSAVDLAAAAVRELLERVTVPPRDMDQVIVGLARLAGVGPNPARQVACRARLPETVPAYTVNQACGSGLRAVMNAVLAVQAGEARLVVAGGTESMSNVPYLLPRARWGYRLGHAEVVDAMYRDGFFCPLCEEVMGETAERLAEEYRISREEQDSFAAESQQRCEAARKEGRFEREIFPIEATDGKGKSRTVAADEAPRDGVTAESLSRLPPVFKEDGTVHAGNSSSLTDGAAVLLVAAEEEARRQGLAPLAVIAGMSTVGVDPARMGIGPVPAVRALLARTGRSLPEIDLVELNEAFAAQVLACQRELKVPPDRLNPNGGAIALGHPVGCSGARITITLLHEMIRRDAKRGLATLCVSGGLGMALLLERP